LVVIPEGDLLLFLSLLLLLPLFVFSVLLSEAKDPGTRRTTRSADAFSPRTLAALALAFLIPVPYSLPFLPSPQTTQKARIPNKDAAI